MTYRYKATLEYDGNLFSGWQKQDNSLSIQQVLEDAIYRLTHEKVTVFASGRTDAGVHALGQVVHFDLSIKYDTYKLILSLNHFLKPHLICIIDCVLVDITFHARFSSIKRHYIYKIINRKTPSIIYKDRALWIKDPLNIQAMKEATSYLIGNHDFTSYRASQCQAKSPIRTLDKIDIIHYDDIHIDLYFTAQSFLHHMVRNIVGSLLIVGKGKWPPHQLKSILLSKDRKLAGATAPSHGLYFLKVDY